jgi:hypothetical protein
MTVQDGPYDQSGTKLLSANSLASKTHSLLKWDHERVDQCGTFA